MKTWFITGACRGFGRIWAEAALTRGDKVAATARELKSIADLKERFGDDALPLALDVTNPEQVRQAVAQAHRHFGRLDVIVNNAGVTRYAYIMDLTEADWDRIHRVNAKGVFFCLQRAAREMIRQNEVEGRGGRIINIASIAGRGYAGTSNAAYAASKGAVIALTKTAAQQLGRHNINVNAICPGVTRTELGARNAAARAAERGISVAELQAEADARIPLGRANAPEDIAAMAVFLASPGARNITGQAYNVDGGLVPS